MKDGLYTVFRSSLCASFVIRDGKVSRSAPILHKNIHYWMKHAVYEGPLCP